MGGQQTVDRGHRRGGQVKGPRRKEEEEEEGGGGGTQVVLITIKEGEKKRGVEGL